MSLSSHQGNNNHAAESSGINGTGIWASWKRNFCTPVLALLDLFDNAMDATIFMPSGKIHVVGDVALEDAHEETGICIINNSYRHIPPLKQVLQVFTSHKSSHLIGEYGVGTKQACASLTDLSFVLTRNKKEYGLGLIASILQQPDKVQLPSFTFTLDENPHHAAFQQCLQGLATRQMEFRCCFEQYGDGDVSDGIERLVRHFLLLSSSNTWAPEEYVFMVVLHDIVHQEGEINGPGPLMDLLAKELPCKYLHVPCTFEIMVRGKPIVFQYWERRLVELTRFTIKIDQENSWKTAPDWDEPETSFYQVNLYMGFDPFRATSSNNKASLLVYSRKMGRLIKHEADARSKIHLDSGGTSYGQGLTIILDDLHGYLPLTPTKQDLAFGDEGKGHIHEENLYTWVGAFAKLYYQWFLDIYKEKKALRLEVESHLDTVRSHTGPIEKTLLHGEFTHFSNVRFRKWRDESIRVGNKKDIRVTAGVDTLVKLNRNPPAPESSRKRTAAELSTPTTVARRASATPAAHPSVRTPSVDDTAQMAAMASATPHLRQGVAELHANDNAENAQMVAMARATSYLRQGVAELNPTTPERNMQHASLPGYNAAVRSVDRSSRDDQAKTMAARENTFLRQRIQSLEKEKAKMAAMSRENTFLRQRIQNLENENALLKSRVEDLESNNLGYGMEQAQPNNYGQMEQPNNLGYGQMEQANAAAHWEVPRRGLDEPRGNDGLGIETFD